MPVYKDGALYNCRVVLLNGKILLIRPKTKLANNGNYREGRWFTPWNPELSSGSHWFPLPSFIAELTQQQSVPFGSDIVIEIVPKPRKSATNLYPIRIGFEMCEEMWVADASSNDLFGQRGVHIIINNSASYWEIRKLHRSLKLMQTSTAKTGGLYAFSNLVGCDGDRLCFYGRSLIVLNGKIVKKTTSIETLFKTVDGLVYYFNPLDVVNYRQQYNIRIDSFKGSNDFLMFDCENPSSMVSAKKAPSLKKLTIQLSNFRHSKTSSVHNKGHLIDDLCPEEEIIHYGCLWLWDYLRRCQSWCKGFMIALSGGLDSASVACLVYCMCHILWNHINSNDGDRNFLAQISTIIGKDDFRKLKGPRDLCNRLLRCCYLKTKFSGAESQKRASDLAHLIGAEFLSIGFTSIYEAMDDLTGKSLNRPPTSQITLRHQNLQARLRMSLTYDLSDCNRLVLGAGNCDEALVGYLTKYDCSSADINPIGSLSKQDLRKLVKYVQQKYFSHSGHVLQSFLDAEPSAELTGESQKDEDDLGLTYEELSLLGRFRRGELGCCGPYTLFCKLYDYTRDHSESPESVDPMLLSTKVKRFFTLHARNRHKQTVLTPALHAETYSPDDNRFDHRQFLFDTTWKRQFHSIDEEVARIIKSRKSRSSPVHD